MCEVAWARGNAAQRASRATRISVTRDPCQRTTAYTKGCTHSFRFVAVDLVFGDPEGTRSPDQTRLVGKP